MVSLSTYILASMFALYISLLPDLALLRDNYPPHAPAWRLTLYRWLALGWRGNRNQWLRLERAIHVTSILIIPIGISLHTVTSWILSTTVQPAWHSTIMGPYFVVGAIFSGLGMLYILLVVARRIWGLEDYIGHAQFQNLELAPHRHERSLVLLYLYRTPDDCRRARRSRVPHSGEQAVGQGCADLLGDGGADGDCVHPLGGSPSDPEASCADSVSATLGCGRRNGRGLVAGAWRPPTGGIGPSRATGRCRPDARGDYPATSAVSGRRRADVIGGLCAAAMATSSTWYSER